MEQLMCMKIWPKQGVARLDGRFSERSVVMIDSSNVNAEFDDLPAVSDEEHDSM